MMCYTLIQAAITGDAIAAQEVLDYFDSYIDSLCMRPILYDGGRRSYQLDTLMKTQLQGKLLLAIMKFKL